MARKFKTPDYLAELRAIEDAELAAVTAAAVALETATAKRDAQLLTINADVDEAESASAGARRHMVETLGMEQSARLLRTTAAKLRKSLPEQKPSAKPVPPAQTRPDDAPTTDLGVQQ